MFDPNDPFAEFARPDYQPKSNDPFAAFAQPNGRSDQDQPEQETRSESDTTPRPDPNDVFAAFSRPVVVPPRESGVASNSPAYRWLSEAHPGLTRTGESSVPESTYPETDPNDPFSGIKNFLTAGVAPDFPVFGGIRTAADTVMQTLQAPGQWLSDRLGLPTDQDYIQQIAQINAEAMRGRGATPTADELKAAANQYAWGQSLLNFLPGSELHANTPIHEPITLERLRALPEPTQPLALGGGDTIPLRGAIQMPPPDIRVDVPDTSVPVRLAGRPEVVDTTARDITGRPTTIGAAEPLGRPDISTDEGLRQQIQSSLARQRANPTPEEGLANRFPISTRDTGTGRFAREATPAVVEVPARPSRTPLLDRLAQTEAPARPSKTPLTDRGITSLTPVGREDLSIASKRIAQPTPAPISFADLQARLGIAPRGVNVPLDVEQQAAQAGQKTRAQAENAARTSMEVERRQAQVRGPLAESGMFGPLVGRAVGRGGSQLYRALRDVEPLDATAGDLNASLVRQSKVHQANEDVIAAMRDVVENGGSWDRVERGLRNVQLLGGDLNHTRARLRAAGLPAPTEGDLLRVRSGPPERRIANTRAGATAPASSFGGTHATPADASKVSGGGGRVGNRLAGLAREEGGSASLRSALGLGFADLARGLARRAGEFSRDQGGEVPLTRTDLERIRMERRGGNSIGSSFDRMVGDTGGPARLSREDVSAPRQRLADQMGVDPKTGRPLGGSGGGTPPRGPRSTSSASNGPHVFGFGDFVKTAGRIANEGAQTTKTVTTAFSPAHFMFRHAVGQLAAHPKAWALGSFKGLSEGLRMTPEQINTRIEQMQRNTEANGVGNLYLSRPHGGLTRGEEDMAAKWFAKLDKVPGIGLVTQAVGRTQQGFAMGLNEIRYMAAQGAINTAIRGEKMGLVKPLTMADRRAIADAINRGTGRGIDTRPNLEVKGVQRAMKNGQPITMDELKGISSLNTKQNIMRALSIPMFSPQLQIARVRVLADGVRGLAGLAKDAASRKPVNAADLERARQGVGLLLGIGATSLIVQAVTGGKQEPNMLATNFGKVDAGQPSFENGIRAFIAAELGIGSNAFVNDRTGQHENVQFDPTASEAALIRYFARQIVSLHDVATGSKDLQKGEGAKMEDNPLQVAYKELVRQLFTSPIAYPLAQWLQGYSISPASAVMPMPVNAALDASGNNLPTIGGPTPKPAPTPRATSTPRADTAPRTPSRAPRPSPTPTPRPTSGR